MSQNNAFSILEKELLLNLLSEKEREINDKLSLLDQAESFTLNTSFGGSLSKSQSAINMVKEVREAHEKELNEEAKLIKSIKEKIFG